MTGLLPTPPHILVAFAVGLLSGFLASFVPGPVNVAIINQGARQGFYHGLFIGLGSTAMEAIYCAVAFAGFASLFAEPNLKAIMELGSFLLMLFLGIKYLRTTTIQQFNPSADKLEQKLHLHSAFADGFIQVLANPGVLLMWIALSASFTAHEWVQDNWHEKISCVAGVAVGCLLWFFPLAFAISRGKGRFSDQTLLRMERLSGLLLLLIAAVLGIRIILLLKAARMHF